MEKYSLYSQEACYFVLEIINIYCKELKALSRQPVKRPNNHSVKESSQLRTYKMKLRI